MSSYCRVCGARQASGTGTCSRDRSPMVPSEGLLGTAAGNYTLVQLIGQGGMGDVYRAINPTIDAQVAIKVLHATAGHGANVERFVHEARTVNRVQHDGVVKILDAGFLATAQPFLVMELLDGESLAQRIARGPVPLASALSIISDVLGVLAAAHAAGIVHRDLKPANVFLARGDRTLVLDFGVAKLTEGNPSITKTGAMVGTPAYMAPEQILARGVDRRADLYAVGVMLFELVTGRRPFDGPTPFAIAQAHVSQPVPRLPPHVPAAVQAVIDRALVKDVDARFSSADDMAAELARVGGVAAPAVASERPASPPRGLWYVLFGLVAVGVLTTLLVLALRADPAPRQRAATADPAQPVAADAGALDAQDATTTVDAAAAPSADGTWLVTGTFRDTEDLLSLEPRGKSYFTERRRRATATPLFQGTAVSEGNRVFVAFAPSGIAVTLSVVSIREKPIVSRWTASTGDGTFGAETWTWKDDRSPEGDVPFAGELWGAGVNPDGRTNYGMAVSVTPDKAGASRVEWRNGFTIDSGIGVIVDDHLVIAATSGANERVAGKNVVKVGLGIYDLTTGSGTIIVDRAARIEHHTEQLRREQPPGR